MSLLAARYPEKRNEFQQNSDINLALEKEANETIIIPDEEENIT